jgi:hypothetical protein
MVYDAYSDVIDVADVPVLGAGIGLWFHSKFEYFHTNYRWNCFRDTYG